LGTALDMAGNNITDANEIKGQTSANLKVESLGTNKLQLHSGEDVEINVGDVTADNVNISGKTNITGDRTQPHTLKVITDMSSDTDDSLHNSMTFVLEGYDSTGTGIKNNVQNSLTFQVADETDTKTVGRFNAEYQEDLSNGGSRIKMISVNEDTGTTEANVEGDVQGTSNGQVDVNCQRFRSNVPFMLPSYTTTERGNLSDVQNGFLILNTTTNKIQARVNNAWVDLH
jgi:hypothetical protein